jgi:glycine/serine hydroxymethyltransferase
LLEALKPEFKEYSKPTITNAKPWPRIYNKGYKIVSGGTDNQLLFLI